MKSIHTEAADRLFDAILTLETKEECYAFFEDLCTVKEIEDMTSRFTTALMLDEGKNYNTISEATGVSTATISRVSKCLQYGPGGYRQILDKLKKKGKA